MSSDSSETRSRILDSALTLLESGEASGVRMADIARYIGTACAKTTGKAHHNARSSGFWSWPIGEYARQQR